jgi:hypothetical protein
LLIGVTLVALVLGYVGRQIEIVRDRQQILFLPDVVVSGMSTREHDRIPLMRWLLGDVQYLWLTVDDSTAEETINRVRCAFPKATVDRYETFRGLPSAPP